jgi:predicted MFS family arabinose efflux permease
VKRLSVEQVRAGYFALTAANTLATQYYLNYLFFYLHDRFGFGNLGNLGVSALYGFICIFSAWQGGRFAERRGYATSIQLGFGSLAVCMVASACFGAEWLDSAAGLVGGLVLYSVVLNLTWPALEAVTTAHAPPARVPHLVGIYNATWSSSAAVAYFTGGALYEALGPVAVFWIPAALFVGQWIVARRLGIEEARSVAAGQWPEVHPAAEGPRAEATHPTSSVPAAVFLRLAWVANPFSYVAIYTVLPVMPGLALRLGLSPTETGIFCSVWMFARLAAFLILWAWRGWHYRFRWLLGAHTLLIVSFAAILLAPDLAVLVSAQIAFGLSIGVIYYSSLFYSLDVGEAKAEHGGIHEAVIGLGSFVGPAVGAGALLLFPGHLYAGALAVSGALAIGLGALTVIWARSRSGRRDTALERVG